jgi:hypothetical protein
MNHDLTYANQDIESLRQRVAELEALRIDALTVMQERDYAITRLAACEKERDDLAQYNISLLRETATSQHYAQQLREALEYAKLNLVCNYPDVETTHAIRMATEALDLHHDTSALGFKPDFKFDEHGPKPINTSALDDLAIDAEMVI